MCARARSTLYLVAQNPANKRSVFVFFSTQFCSLSFLYPFIEATLPVFLCPKQSNTDQDGLEIKKLRRKRVYYFQLSWAEVPPSAFLTRSNPFLIRSLLFLYSDGFFISCFPQNFDLIIQIQNCSAVNDRWISAKRQSLLRKGINYGKITVKTCTQGCI